MLHFCCWKHHQSTFQGCKAQMDFTSLCISPEPKLNSQVKLTPQHMGRCLGCTPVPHPGCSSGSQEKWRSPQKSGFGENFAKITIKKKRCKGQLCFCIGNVMRIWPLGWKYTSQLFPFQGFPPLESACLFASRPQGSALTLFFSPIAGKDILDPNSKTPVPQSTSAVSTHVAHSSDFCGR